MSTIFDINVLWRPRKPG